MRFPGERTPPKIRPPKISQLSHVDGHSAVKQGRAGSKYSCQCAVPVVPLKQVTSEGGVKVLWSKANQPQRESRSGRPTTPFLGLVCDHADELIQGRWRR